MNELLRRVFNLPLQASSIAAELDALHYVIILTSIAGAGGVALAIGLFSLRRAAPRGVGRSEPARATAVRIEGAAIALLLLFFLGLWAVGYRQYMALRVPPAGALDVYVIAKQWMWSFAYADGTASNADLYVPSGRPVRLLMTSRDVIHSFFVPAFRVKQDVVPGRMTVAWFEAVREGAHDILCAEYCGLSHSHMRGRVIVLSPAAYESWQRRQQTERAPLASASSPEERGEFGDARASLAQYGQRVAAERGCLRCHTLDGTPHIGPTWAGLYGSSIPLSDRTTLVADDAYLTESMMDPRARLRRGFAPVMPSYFGLLAAPETAALVALIHSLQHVAPARATPLAPAAAPGQPERASELLPRTHVTNDPAGRVPEPAIKPEDERP